MNDNDHRLPDYSDTFQTEKSVYVINNYITINECDNATFIPAAKTSVMLDSSNSELQISMQQQAAAQELQKAFQLIGNIEETLQILASGIEKQTSIVDEIAGEINLENMVKNTNLQ
ncbi:hypothetical protein GJ496_011402 [Pomphorhynchus laevis]|nr:hypothetical protein GJ496_011402 [Pomphorhynchus laevis]